MSQHFSVNTNACVYIIPVSEMQTDGWVADSVKADMDTAAQEQGAAEDDDLDCDVTYGEVEQRLDQLQEHLSR